MIINRMSQETAALFRAQLHGKPAPKLKSAKRVGPKVMCQEYFSHNPQTLVALLQLPVYVDQQQIREFVPPARLSGEQIRNVLRARRKGYVDRRDVTAAKLEHYFPHGILELRMIEFVRFSMYAGGPKEMDDDNLSAVFKPIRDALCAYAWHGREWRKHIDQIGNADGYLKQIGVTWLYKQKKCASNPRAHGIQLRLHCAPHTTTP